jgi:hypothetical protein
MGKEEAKATKIEFVDIGPKAPLEPLPSLRYDLSSSQEGTYLEAAPTASQPIPTRFWIRGNGLWTCSLSEKLSLCTESRTDQGTRNNRRTFQVEETKCLTVHVMTSREKLQKYMVILCDLYPRN